MIGFIQVDEVDNCFYVIGNKVGIYILEGMFVEDLFVNFFIIYVYYFGNKCIGVIVMFFMLFQNGSFGIGVF